MAQRQRFSSKKKQEAMELLANKMKKQTQQIILCDIFHFPIVCWNKGHHENEPNEKLNNNGNAKTDNAKLFSVLYFFFSSLLLEYHTCMYNIPREEIPHTPWNEHIDYHTFKPYKMCALGSANILTNSWVFSLLLPFGFIQFCFCFLVQAFARYICYNINDISCSI